MFLYLAAPPIEGPTPESADDLNALMHAMWKMGHTVLVPSEVMGDAYTLMTESERRNVIKNLIQRSDAVIIRPEWVSLDDTAFAASYANLNSIPIYTNDIPEMHITESRCPAQCEGFMSEIMNLYRTHLRKNADYSPANILGTGKIGVVVRMWDKMARLMNLHGFNLKIETCEMTAKREPANEAIEDSFLDMSCYAIIAKLLNDGKWGH